MNKRKLSVVVAAALIAVGSVAVEPTQAALLDFSFTTENGGTGSFTLNTDTAPNPETVRTLRPELTGITFNSAVSNFSFSAPYVNVSSDSTNWSFVPSVTSDVLGLPPNLGVLSGVNYPSGCTTPTSFTCTLNIALLSSGNFGELSDDPLSYRGIGIQVNDPVTRDFLLRDDITNFRVVTRIAVPESNSGLSVLAFGVGSLGLLFKHKMNLVS